MVLFTEIMEKLTMDELEAELNGSNNQAALVEIIRRARERDATKRSEQVAREEIKRIEYVWTLQHRCIIQHIRTLRGYVS